MAKEKPFWNITGSDDLLDLEREIRTGRRRHRSVLKVDIKGISKEESGKLSNDLTRNYYACGCAEATFAGFAALIATGALGYLNYDSFGLWPVLGFGILGFFGGVFLGKSLGLSIAKVRLHRMAKRLRDHVGPAQLDPSKPTAACAH
ncbi:MAG: hypothetical protein AAF826_08255 [Pseudomonadota bacterium]